MAKISSGYPAYSSGTVNIDGSKATTGVKNCALNANYDMSDSESAIYNYALNTLASILPQVNTFDANTLSTLQSEVDAYQNSGVQKINNLYNSSLLNLENDAASRFGNLDNSMFKDNLNSLEAERSNAISSFAQDVMAKQSDLTSDELTKRYALVNLLSGLSNDIYSNALSAISTAMNGSSSMNNYNDNLYSALSAMAKTSSNSSSNTLNSLVSGLLGNGTNLSSLLSMM